MADLLEQVLGSTVYGPQHEKIGKVKQVYVDRRTGQPTWASVSTGMFSSDSLVPLTGASVDNDEVLVPVNKEAVKSAPHLDSQGQIGAAEEQELLRHYGVEGQTGITPDRGVGRGDTPGEASRQDAGESSRPDAQDAMTRSEEQLRLDSQTVPTGKAQLRKDVVEEQQTFEVPTRHEEARLVREPITDPTDRSAQIGEDTREVTLHEDQVNVSKESVPQERVRLEVDEVEESQRVDETLRKERIEGKNVDRGPGEGRW